MGNQSSHHSTGSRASGTDSPHHSHREQQHRSRSPPESTVLAVSSQVVDGGFLEPQTHLYASAPLEYSRPVVHKLIIERKLAPFYLGLNDFESDWTSEQVVEALNDADQQASSNLREALNAATQAAAEAEVAQLSNPATTRRGKEAAAAAAAATQHKENLNEIIQFREKRGATQRSSTWADQAQLYVTKAIECPICFLYYPPPMVHTRCCDQPICTECFVQIKRADPTTTHLESEPAACPFCMEPNFGCFYFRENTEPIRPVLPKSDSNGSAISTTEVTSLPTPMPTPTPKPRRKSYAHTEPQVVTTDHLHPDWEAKVEAMKAIVARRANRRIVFRQVGDRLIPIGITSGREGDGANATLATTQLPPGFAAQVAAALDASNHSTSREGRRAHRRRNQEIAQYLESMGINVGPDLEEMMVMEAMRLSLQEDEERQRKEREAKENAAASGSGDAADNTAESSAQGAARSEQIVNLLSEAIAEPIGHGSDAHTPALGNTPTGAPSPISLRASSGHDRSHHGSAAGALAVGSLGAAVGTPRSSVMFPHSGESTNGTSVGRSVVGAGLTASIPARSSSGAPAPTTAPIPAPPVTFVTPAISMASTTTPADVPSSSSLLSSASTRSRSGTQVSSVSSVSTRTFDSDFDSEVPLTPSQGYQQLEDVDDEDEEDERPTVSTSNGNALPSPPLHAKRSDERVELRSPAQRSSHSLVDIS